MILLLLKGTYRLSHKSAQMYICAHRMIRQNRCAFVLVPAWVGQFIELNSFLSSDRVIRPSNAVIRPLKVNSNKLSASKADGSRFHHMVAVGTQVWVSWVRILCRVRLSGWFGRVGPGYRLDGLDPKYPFRLVTLDCGYPARI